MKVNVMSLAFVAIITLSSCKNDRKTEAAEVSATSEKNTSMEYELIGKKARYVYPEFEAEVAYISETKLHWKTTDAEGNVAEDDEEISYQKLNDTQFFVNWIEKDGYTVSQVIDMEKGTVIAYLSHQDNNSDRGQRAADFVEGKWIEIE